MRPILHVNQVDFFQYSKQPFLPIIIVAVNDATFIVEVRARASHTAIIVIFFFSIAKKQKTKQNNNYYKMNKM